MPVSPSGPSSRQDTDHQCSPPPSSLRLLRASELSSEDQRIPSSQNFARGTLFPTQPGVSPNARLNARLWNKKWDTAESEGASLGCARPDDVDNRGLDQGGGVGRQEEELPAADSGREQAWNQAHTHDVGFVYRAQEISAKEEIPASAEETPASEAAEWSAVVADLTRNLNLCMQQLKDSQAQARASRLQASAIQVGAPRW